MHLDIPSVQGLTTGGQYFIPYNNFILENDCSMFCLFFFFNKSCFVIELCLQFSSVGSIFKKSFIYPLGQQARDALLLIMQLSNRNEQIARYIVENTNFCPVKRETP